MLDTVTLFLTSLLFTAFCSLQATLFCIIKLGRYRTRELLNSSKISTFLLEKLMRTLFPQKTWDQFFLLLLYSWQIVNIVFGIYFTNLFFDVYFTDLNLNLIIKGLITVTLSTFLNFCLQLISAHYPKNLLRTSLPLSFFLLTIFSPIIGIILKILESISPQNALDTTTSPPSKKKLKELIKESELQIHLDSIDQKLINSFIHFKERVAKEIMVPRVDLFSLSAETTIKDASILFFKEGYSRIPIYHDTLDNIVGVVLYKDLLKYFLNTPPALEKTLDSIAKPVLYTPENKKVSQLLQEFRTKQIHMAIVVDEYGGTEGIVTIEDILEELVGEIEDEYDIDEEHVFVKTADGGYIIDAKMTLLDIAEQIGIHIPTHPEYETLGGYVYHCAGTIPSKGWSISHDEFYLEVLSSNERAIKKIKIIQSKKNY